MTHIKQMAQAINKLKAVSIPTGIGVSATASRLCVVGLAATTLIAPVGEKFSSFLPMLQHQKTALNSDRDLSSNLHQMHDQAQRKTSESYNKIVDAIIIKIQKTFNEPREIAESIKKRTKKVFIEPTCEDAATTGTPEQKARKDRLNEQR